MWVNGWRQVDVEEFQRYGIIKLVESENIYSAFSKNFQEYLKLIEREFDLWPLWRDTEIALRQVIATTMIKQYGGEWIKQLEKHSSLKNLFIRCREAQQKEENSFGSRASKNLIDFTYPNELFSIIFAEWNSLKTIFGKDKTYWSQRAALLSKIRNPLAHNRDMVLYDYERKTAEGYCKEIIEITSQADQ